MENRLNQFFNQESQDPQNPKQPKAKLVVNENERIMSVILSADVPYDPDEENGETYKMEMDEIYVRERDFNTFTKVLHDNFISYRVDTLK